MVGGSDLFMKYFSWKDIERVLLKNKKKWEKVFSSFDIYPDEFIVYLIEDVKEEAVRNVLEDIFPKNIDISEKIIKLDGKEETIDISFETQYCDIKRKTLPLFERIIYQESVYPEEKLQEMDVPVIAFHSYKGGVGRTLSLLAFAKAWTNINRDDASNKLLIVDSDIEAPGLTWIQGGHNKDDYSYLDLLSQLQDCDDLDEVIEVAKREIGRLSIPIETDQEKVEHLFLPTFRYDEQLFDLYASPNSVIKSKDKQYILAEALSKIAYALGASAVLVDLRAGISEYSAPLLFDPRVKKYLVSSTSYQSVVGTEKLLEYMSKGLVINEESNLPTVLLSMVTPSLDKSEKENIYSRLVECFKIEEGNEQLLDNLVIELPFASELIHLTRMEQIFHNLQGRDMYYVIEDIVRQYYGKQEIKNAEFSDEQRQEMLRKIHAYADNQITAEANGALDLLLTQPIKNLCLRFSSDIPYTVVRGAKGSGKTFLYSKLLEKKEWNLFCKSINVNQSVESLEAYFLPVLAPRNTVQLNEILQNCIKNLNENISFAQVEKDVYLENLANLEQQCQIETDWLEFWEKFFANSIKKGCDELEKIDSQLNKENKKIIYLIDGLEEVLRNVSSEPIQRKAVQVLCQDMVNKMMAKYENIGIIVFLRSDMAQNAISVNYEQFKQSYAYAELKWDSNEALKLAIWLVSQSIKGFYESKKPIDKASKEVIDKHLQKLWGLKLGKPNSNEAYSSRWILAALSDFHGQLQARDIIRFLKHAAVPSTKKAPYKDRIIMPSEIRNAVSICSREKIDEIKMEYEELNPILEKLAGLPQGKKVLPLNLGEESLSSSEEKLMIQEGYLTRDKEKLYLPEIIRHALGFRYEKGARPKVLSLILKN